MPKRHLRKFEIQDDPEDPRRSGHPPGYVWECNKLYKKWHKYHVGKVAQIDKFYPKEVENNLACTIESDGGDAIDKLLQLERIDLNERRHIVVYLGCQMLRTPVARKRAMNLLPDSLKEAISETKSRFDCNDSEYELFMDEIDRIEKEYSKKLPQDLEDRILRTPYPSNAIVDAINHMQWEFWYTEDSENFLTSDNPFFFTRGIGLKGSKDSQFFLPLSSNTVLYGHRYHYYDGISLLKVSSRVVRQINRRTIANADCRIYSSKKAVWIPMDFNESDHKQYLQWDRKVLKNLLKVD